MDIEKRKSMRIKVSIPVKIFAMTGNVRTYLESAAVVNLAKHGACLMTGQFLESGQTLLLETPHSGLLDTEVRWVGDPNASALRPVGVHRKELAAAFGYAIPAKPSHP